MNYLSKIIAFLTLIFGCFSLFAQDNQICFTIDDLPLSRLSKYPPEQHDVITGKILESLKKYQIPAIGFVNENKLYNEGNLIPAREQLLIKWLESGMELGNHTYSHPDYNKMTFDSYKAEILKGQKIIGKLGNTFGKPIRYFRHPYLHRGNNQFKADSLETYLKSIGLIEAPVTIDNSEWVFSAAYDSAMLTNDHSLMNDIGNSYISYMEDKVHYYEKQSNKLFRRNISQILLIHANALNGEFLDELAGMLVKNQYAFISISDALKDQAYTAEDHYYGTSGISWLDRWALTQGYTGDFFLGEPTTPDFIKKLAKVVYE